MRKRTLLQIPCFVALFALFGCGKGPEGPKTTQGQPPPGMATQPARPTTPRATSPAPAPSACVDPVLIEAFGKLTSCNFKAGVIDYQCAAWKAVHKVIGERERENKALVQLSLVQLLSHADERVRLVAAKSLSNYALQKSVVAELIKAYGRDKSAYVRAWVVHSLHSPRPEATRAVLKALAGDASPVVRARAAQRLNIAHYAKDPAVAKALVVAIKGDKSVDVRKRAAESLGTLRKDPATEKLLVDCLADAKIGPHCAIGLGRMRSKTGYGAVLKILRNGLKKNVVHPLYVWTIMDFLGQAFFRATEVRNLLMAIARNQKMPSGARHYAVKSLGRLGRQVANQRARVLQFLKGLAGDKVLGISVKPTLKQLQQPAPGRRPRR